MGSPGGCCLQAKINLYYDGAARARLSDMCTTSCGCCVQHCNRGNILDANPILPDILLGYLLRFAANSFTDLCKPMLGSHGSAVVLYCNVHGS